MTDHVVIAEHEAGKGWGPARIVPAGSCHADVASGAMQYGLSIFEGLKAHRSGDGVLRLFRPDMHARRFAHSAERLCMPEVPVETFVNAVRALVRVDGDWCGTRDGASLYVRPTLFADESYLGVRPSSRHVFAVLISAVDSYWEAGEHALKLWVEREYVRAAKGGVGNVKTGGNYAASLAAAGRAQSRGFDQVLWMDAVKHEFIEEAGTMNVFVRIGDQVITPPLGGTILAGVTRDSCLALLRSWGVAVEERPIALAEVLEAAARESAVEIWGTGTAAVVAPIAELAWEDGRIVSTGAELSGRLRTAIEAMQSGREPDTFGWLANA